MSNKKSNGSRKDPLKNPKVWEKARREKMKIYFNELQEVLPFYDPSAPMSRFEILQKSKSYIKDLQDQNQDLLNGGFDEVYRIKMTKLKQRVKELLKRVDQLTDLLRTANIMIPPIEAYPDAFKTQNTFKWMNQRPKKWTEKINLVVPDDKIKSVLTLIKDYKKNAGKTNPKKKESNEKSDSVISEPSLQKSVIKKKKVFKKINKVANIKNTKTVNSGSAINYEKRDSSSESQSPSQFKENQPVDFNLLSNKEPSVSKSNNRTSENVSVSVETTKTVSSAQVSATTVTVNKIINSPQKFVEQNVILPPAQNVLQSNTYILTNDGSLVQLPILNSSGSVFNANSNILAQTAIVKPNTGLFTPLVINKPSPVIVLQKPAAQIIQTAQIINPTPQVISVSQAGIQILGSSLVYTSSNSITKTLPHILSRAPSNKKRIGRDSTVTTYVNKIPIPALSKQSYARKPASGVDSKEKGVNTKSKDELDKEENKKESDGTQTGKENETESSEVQKENTQPEVVEKEKDKNSEKEPKSDCSKKRDIEEEKIETHKRQKVDKSSYISEENVFKPIENEADGMFCNLALPNSINPSLSVSPTAAFLSSFPIVAPARSEVEDEICDRKTEEVKEPKQSDQGESNVNKTSDDSHLSKENSVSISKKCLMTESNSVQIQTEQKLPEMPKEQMKLLPNNNINAAKINLNQHLESCKPWEQFNHENFYLPPDNTIHLNNPALMEVPSAPAINFPGITNNINNTYNSYPQNSMSSQMGVPNIINDQVTFKNNQFEYTQKDNYLNKMPSHSSEKSSLKKQCSAVGDSYNVPKTQPSNYQLDSGPTYQLIPAKDVPNQRNAKTVNWMTEPDVRGLVYSSQNDKMISGKAPIYTQSDNFYVNNQNLKIPDCSSNFMTNDLNKMPYQNYVKDQRCKNQEKRADAKCYTKTPQNSYNIFDYNYAGSCYNDEETNKYCNVQYPGKTKKNGNQSKKKSEEVQVNDNQLNDPTKRLQDPIITNLDFTPVANQECFTWIPGKNVDWLPSKSFGLDSNLVVPSTLPTLMGDLALGTTSADINQTKTLNSKISQPNLKPVPNDINKEYIDLGMGSNALAKSIEAMDANKQYLEPFANLSKNIFDVTPTNMHNSQMPKNDFDKINFGNNNETIVLKNIFELPVSKNSDFSRSKQRTVNSSQNTFLSVSQLVEPPAFEPNSAIKNDNQMETTTKDMFTQNSQNYSNYHNHKTYKNKSRSSHCKYNDRKYHNYKNASNSSSNSSSSYTAEALIRSNTNVSYQPNEFPTDVNTNFFNGKPNQKIEQFPSNNKIEFDINMKSDFTTGPSQNIYSDFNFSSPVPNFTIGPTMTTDFGTHDASNNFSAQNNFFGDFITPEYPLTDNVSNSLLLPPCTIALQNPFVVEKRNPTEKTKNNSKQYSSRNRKHYDCSKSSYNDFSLTTTSAIFTTSSISCPTIFTTSACQNLLPVPTQSIPISFSSPSFSSSNISFPPPLTTNANSNYHRFPNASQNSVSNSFLTPNSMFTTCTTKPLTSSNNCYTSNPLTTVTNSVISSSFPVGNVPFTASSQSSIPFFSLSNPIIPSSAPTSSSNSLANFNLSTIFPEINQKGNYHYS